MQIKEQFEQYLKNIDFYFEEKSKNTFQMYCAIIVIAIFGFAYLMYYEDMYQESESFFNQRQQSLATLESKKNEYKAYFGDLSMERAYIDGFVNGKIRNIAVEIEGINKKREVVDNTRLFFKNKLDELSYLLFSDKKGAEFAKSLTSLAEKYRLNIGELRYNSYINNGGMQKVSPVLNIELELFGEFRDIVRYINSIEKSKMVVDVNYLNFYKIDGDRNNGRATYNRAYAASNEQNKEVVSLNHKQVNVKIKISIWGVN